MYEWPARYSAFIRSRTPIIVSQMRGYVLHLATLHGTLSEMRMVLSSTIAVGPIAQTSTLMARRVRAPRRSNERFRALPTI